MRLLIDTNILLYAANQSVAEHPRARQFLEDHLRSGTSWCLTWPVIYEFLRVSTHPRIFSKPLKADEAMRYVDALFASPSLTMLVPGSRHRGLLQQTLSEIGSPAGNLFHDIATAVTMREHGVPEIVTADSDFHQFEFLSVRNPMLSTPPAGSPRR